MDFRYLQTVLQIRNRLHLPTEGASDCLGITFIRSMSLHFILVPPGLSKSRANNIVLLLRSSIMIHAPARAPFASIVLYCFVRQVGTHNLTGNPTVPFSGFSR